VPLQVSANGCRLESKPLSDSDRHKIPAANQRVDGWSRDSEQSGDLVDRKQQRKSVRDWQYVL
jgi:hypothetical protein